MSDPATAICFRCGTTKPRALDTCTGCGSSPRTNRDYLVSAALSTFLSSESELLRYRDEILAGEPPSVPHETLLRAIEALKDPAALTVLRSRPLGATPSTAPAPVTAARTIPPASAPLPAQPANLGRPSPPNPKASAPAPGRPTARGVAGALLESPFAMLGATSHDSRRRIGELAEAGASELGDDLSRQARAALTNPNTRLGSEIGWLPGVDPEDVARLLGHVRQAPLAIGQEPGLPTLAHLNLLAAAIQAIDGEAHARQLAALVQDIGSLAQHLDSQAVFREINADRAISGFGPLLSADQIEPELAQRQRYYRAAIQDALDRLPSATLIQVMTDTAQGATGDGGRHAPGLVEELIDRYETEAQAGFLPMEAKNIGKLIDGSRIAANARQTELDPHIKALDVVVQNWNKVARPIQLNARARGMDHGASRQIADDIRSLGIYLFDQHGLLTPALRIMNLLRQHFDAMPAISERAARDAIAIEGLSREQERPAPR